MTILTAIFAYNASVYEVRKRNPTTLRLRGEAPVTVSDLAGEEAPLALRIKPDDGGSTDWIDIRVVDGKTFRPLLGPDREQLTVAGFEDACRRATEGELTWRDYPFPRQTRGYAVENVFALPEPKDFAIRENLASEAAEGELACAEIVAGMRIVDGALFIRCPEPTWRISTAYGVFAAASRLEPEIKANVIHVRMDGRDRVERLLRELGGDKGIGGEADILRPDLLGFDERRFHARCLALRALPALAGAIGSMRSNEPIELFLKMRRLAARISSDEQAVDALFETACSFAGADLEQSLSLVDSEGNPASSENRSARRLQKRPPIVTIAKWAEVSGFGPTEPLEKADEASLVL